MLYYDRIDLSEGIDLAKSNSSKNLIFITIGFLIMGPNFRILSVTVVVI